MWGYQYDNGFTLLNRLPCLYEVGRSRNTVKFVTPCLETRFFQTKGNRQGNVTVFFNMADENIAHWLLLLCANNS
jgi:hypothetical protein